MSFRRLKVLVKIFDKSDFGLLREWIEKRGLDIPLEDLPRHGYTVYSILSESPVAIGFIRMSGSIGFIEGLTTNPESSSEDRNEAIDTLIKHLLAYAKRQGIKRVIGYTLHENIVARTEKLGFKKQPHVLVSIDLGE